MQKFIFKYLFRVLLLYVFILLDHPPVSARDILHKEVTQTDTATCRASTFILRIPVNPGEKIVLSALQTFPDGNFLATGTLTAPSGIKDGILFLLTNDGKILQQKRIQVDTRSTIINSAKISITGRAIISGIYDDGSSNAFLLAINEDFSIKWSKIIALQFKPDKALASIFDRSKIAFATMVSDNINFSTYDSNGNKLWNNQVNIPFLKEVVGFTGSSNAYNTLSLSFNCLINNIPSIQVMDINKADGSKISSSIQSISNINDRAFAVTSFSDRVNLIGISKDPSGGYYPFRSNISRGPLTETLHTYLTDPGTNISATMAIDNAGDAIGFFNPKVHQLYFINHFSSTASSIKYSREYSFPLASDLAAITRSFDGGFLFGLNILNNNEFILMKTDSSGFTPCGYTNLDINNSTSHNINNTAVSCIMTPSSNTEMGAIYSNRNSNYIETVDCKQSYCPPSPPIDSCQTDYFKTLRSYSFQEHMDKYFIMKNNLQFIVTSKYDRVVGNENNITYGLKTLDERGNLIKAVNIFNPSSTVPFDAFQLDETQALLVYNASDSEQKFNLTLIDENLNKVWSRTIKTNNDFNSQGLGVSDVHKDAEGNIYLVSSQLGYTIKPKVFIYKMDSLGNEVWTRAFQLSEGSFYQVNITSSPSGVIIIINGSEIYSMFLTKEKGDVINSYSFEGNWDGSTNQRYMKYSNGRVFYAGSDKSQRFLVGTFDSTGKPLLMKHFNTALSVFIAAAVKDGNLYGVYNTPKGTPVKEVLFKTDADLNIQFINSFDQADHRISAGMAISEEGYIYNGGNLFYNNDNYADPYIIKYNPLGELGSCPSSKSVENMSSEVPIFKTLSFTNLDRKYPHATYSLNLIPDSSGLNIDRVICSSVSKCSFIKLKQTGPTCNLNTSYTLQIKKSTGCLSIPEWIYDSTISKLINTTDTTATFLFLKTGNIKIVTALNTGCTIFKDSVTIQVQPAPSSLKMPLDTTLCTGTVLILKAGPGFDHYLWQDGSTDSNYIVKNPGQFIVSVSNTCGNPKTDTIQVVEKPKPSGFIHHTDSLCIYTKKTISTIGAFKNYLWSTGSDKSAITIDKPGTYSLTVSDINSCTATDSIIIFTRNCPLRIYLPNAFTPNGDHINDVFKAISYAPLLQFSLSIYNRWGQKIFFSDDVTKGWDGTYKGCQCDIGLYTWICNCRFENGELQNLKGSVLLGR